jgi:glyoxylase-like metal-dependent hydrolase (beta-lactamase superfamily II)
VLRESRQRVLELRPTQIIPGHGPAFVPTDATPV